MMTRSLLLTFASLLAVSACDNPEVTTPVDPTFAMAGGSNPHFVRASAELSGANLVVSFKEAGLGNNQLIDYTASADATATYACRNRGGNFPKDPKKQEATGPVSTTDTFASGKNGQITATLTIEPPESTLSCPPGQDRVLLDVSYTNVQISDDTNEVTESIPGTFSVTFIEI